MNNNGLLFGILCFIGAAVVMTFVGNFIAPKIGNIAASYYTQKTSDIKQTGTEKTAVPRQTEEAVKEPVEKTDLEKKKAAVKSESDTVTENTSDEMVRAEPESVTPDMKEAVPEEMADSAKANSAELIEKEVGTVISYGKEEASEDAAGSGQLEAVKKKIAQVTEQEAETVTSDVKKAFTELVEKKEEAAEVVEKETETVTRDVKDAVAEVVEKETEAVTSDMKEVAAEAVEKKTETVTRDMKEAVTELVEKKEEAAEVVVTEAETATPDIKTTEPEKAADSDQPEEIKEDIAEKPAEAEKDKKIVKTAEDVSKITTSLKNGESADLGDGRIAYKVKGGDTFSKICQKVLGTSLTWKEEAEKMGIDHRRIFPGKVLIFETEGE
ncbi:hypothetical protein [Desulfonema magnum]|uniref:LysM domain-containing protein n=1 Tax=Desulfonema magnum TaxID=45655 RepID=A0A975BIL5_9BACT|nr:hypothetical protein [Desulfonema magnum]QTA86374.1 Uncharacterized protein dnm_023980 [Desulfonema magnum]